MKRFLFFFEQLRRQSYCNYTSRHVELHRLAVQWVIINNAASDWSNTKCSHRAPPCAIIVTKRSWKAYCPLLAPAARSRLKSKPKHQGACGCSNCVEGSNRSLVALHQSCEFRHLRTTRRHSEPHPSPEQKSCASLPCASRA
jgi:hypothetical protein